MRGPRPEASLEVELVAAPPEDRTAMRQRARQNQRRLLRLMNDLARSAAQVSSRAKRERATVETSLVYIKAAVAYQTPRYDAFRVNEEPLSALPLEEVQGARLEELLDEMEEEVLAEFELDGEEWRQFLMDVLNLTRSALDQRIHRSQSLRPLREFLGETTEAGR